jgi:hypothetical protein
MWSYGRTALKQQVAGVVTACNFHKQLAAIPAGDGFPGKILRFRRLCICVLVTIWSRRSVSPCFSANGKDEPDIESAASQNDDHLNRCLSYKEPFHCNTLSSCQAHGVPMRNGRLGDAFGVEHLGWCRIGKVFHGEKSQIVSDLPPHYFL